MSSVIDLSIIPEWANFIAMNSDGSIYAYESEPLLSRNGWDNVSRKRFCFLRKRNDNVEKIWRDSLVDVPLVFKLARDISKKQEENKVDENKLPVIDISKTFQAYVWDGDNEPKYDGRDEIREIVVAFSNGECIDSNLAVWEHYELIKEPMFRKFRNHAEFIQWLRDTGRTDTRHLDFKGAFWGSLNVTPATDFELLLMCKWFDNGEPIGVKE